VRGLGRGLLGSLERVAALLIGVPLTALLSLCVLVVERWPPILRQTRIGRDGTPYRCWKLRTLPASPKPTKVYPTAFGAWIRNHGLDEVPQLINIIQGHMRLAGPRPLPQETIDGVVMSGGPAAVTDRRRWAASRQACDPGIIGLAQLHQGGEYVRRGDWTHRRGPTVRDELRVPLDRIQMDEASWRIRVEVAVLSAAAVVVGRDRFRDSAAIRWHERRMADRYDHLAPLFAEARAEVAVLPAIEGVA
jgi:lipopolysaccharide/colanic/teichoic acid biosynthesis glycosyltransferase